MKNQILLLMMVFLSISEAIAQDGQNYNPRFNSENNCMMRYFYYPNLEAYFDTKNNYYIYRERGQWKTAAEIPSGYRGYSLNNGYNVPIDDYDDDDIVQFIDIHKKKYPYMSKSRKTSMVYRN